jgi:hypothetical protein
MVKITDISESEAKALDRALNALYVDFDYLETQYDRLDKVPEAKIEASIKVIAQGHGVARIYSWDIGRLTKWKQTLRSKRRTERNTLKELQHSR